MIIRSLCYGYFGAALGGLAIGVAGAIFGTSLDTIVAAASPTGIVTGMLGLSLPWVRRVAVRIRTLPCIRASGERRRGSIDAM